MGGGGGEWEGERAYGLSTWPGEHNLITTETAPFAEIPVSQSWLTRLVRLSCNCRLVFCCTRHSHKISR